jgi:hypothetical protein
MKFKRISKAVFSGNSTMRQIINLIVILSMVLGYQSTFVVAAPNVPAAPAQVALTNDLTLNVIAQRTDGVPGGTIKGDPVTQYKYLINYDNTATTEQRTTNPADGCSPDSPGYPASCNWVSIAGAATHSPIYTSGDQDDFNGVNGTSLSLPSGRYVISVLADGYKLGGLPFTVPLPESGLTVELDSTNLPAATIQAAVFEDISPVNGAPDVPAEHGLAGFQGHIADYLGEVTTDVFGNPLCTDYDSSSNPIPGSGGRCLSKCYVVDNGVDIAYVDPIDDAGVCPTVTTDGMANTPLVDPAVPVVAGMTVEGKLKIPNVGPNRYALSIVPPDGTTWIQTTTLEGNHDWDAWVMEGATGLDTEFVVSGEPFPAIIFGYVRPTPMSATGGTSHITGVIDAVKVYYPPTGGVTLPGTIFGGITGMKLDKPLDNAWVTLTDLTNGDTAIYAGPANADGSFDIANVPAGNYTLTWWDEPQDYILDLINVTVGANEPVVDLGVLPLNGWWTFYDGYVFNDENRNGVMDWQDLNNNGCPDPGEGEQGVPNYTLTMRKRENSLMDRGATVVTTDACGYYFMENAYPMTQWLVMEAYSDLYYTTGVTYQADNQPTPTTVTGAGVDVSVLPIIGLSGKLDWGVHSYDATGANGIDPRNGGIVGTVSYDTTRNELDPRFAAVEDWQPGIPNLNVNLYATVLCTPGAPDCDPETGLYQLDTDGSYKKGNLLNTYLTETWERPTGCVARDVNGNPLVHGVDEQVLPLDPNADCLEGPLMGNQFQTGYSTVDGNYGFGDGCFGDGGFDTTTGTCADGSDPTPLPGGTDYLVEVEIPDDALGRPMYKVTREEDINIGNGDQFYPQVPPPACAGPLHTVDVAGMGTDGYPGVFLPGGINVPPSTPTENATFLDIGASPYEGLQKPLCTTKLVQLNNGKSIVPTFNLFTDVPIPGRFWGLIVDDLNFSSDPKSLLYGEKAGVPFAPVGIYDWTNHLVTTVESDYNGLFDVLLPSTNRISCPTPSGVCANLYRMVGNDPGVPGRLNPNFKPEFRTIAAEFEAFPGLLVPADLAPTQVGVTVQLPGGQTQTVDCTLDQASPELFAVDKPYVTLSGSDAQRTITIKGANFGAGQGLVTLDGIPLDVVAPGWTDTQITVRVRNAAPNAVTQGPHQLVITDSNAHSTVNGLTIHVLGGNGSSAYNPRIFEVGPGRAYAPAETLPAAADHAIQRALDDAASYIAGGNNRNALVVVYPNDTSLDPRQNPRGAYYENLIIASKVKLQGVGPGGFQGTTFVAGSIIDGGAFAGDSPVAADWYTKIGSLTWDGNQNINDGAVISIYVPNSGRNAFPTTYSASTAPAIDGFDLRGGDQQGFPTNINQVGGLPTGLPANVVTQGGAIFANAFANNLQITNNTIQNNGGGYGTVRLGTPDLTAPNNDNHNWNVRILHNRIIANAGTNLAGGIGIFASSNNYEVANNDLCGNFSAEYGGGLSVYGLSPNGQIHDNRIYFNRSYDEGGGVIIAGELPTDPNANYGASGGPKGSGSVNIYNNLIQSNLGNDDGGGLRFLMAGNFPMNVYNNFIVNNVSTHEGGGIGINDAPNVRVYNNTIMKNITTATALTSNGSPAPAGLSTSQNSAQLQATLSSGAPTFSNPLLFNNIFWDNRAGTRSGGIVTGLIGDPLAVPAHIDNWDLGVADGTGLLAPTNSVVQQNAGVHPYTADPSNRDADPMVIESYDTAVAFNVWRNNPNFIGAILVSVSTPAQLLGNYHLTSESPAINLGDLSKAVPSYQQPPASIAAPAEDIDHQPRPSMGGYDTGGDEVVGNVLAFPRTGVLDNFTGGGGGTALGSNWAGVQSQITSAYRRNSNAAQARAVVTPLIYWAPSAFGPNQEAYMTLTDPVTTASDQALALKITGLNGNAVGPNTALILVSYNQTSNLVQVRTLEPTAPPSANGVWKTWATFSIASGNFQLGARVLQDGSVSVYRTGILIGSTNVTTGANPWPAQYVQGGGSIGVWYAGTSNSQDASFDAFGGGTMPPALPDAMIAPRNVLNERIYLPVTAR